MMMMIMMINSWIPSQRRAAVFTVFTLWWCASTMVYAAFVAPSSLVGPCRPVQRTSRRCSTLAPLHIHTHGDYDEDSDDKDRRDETASEPHHSGRETVGGKVATNVAHWTVISALATLLAISPLPADAADVSGFGRMDSNSAPSRSSNSRVAMTPSPRSFGVDDAGDNGDFSRTTLITPNAVPTLIISSIKGKAAAVVVGTLLELLIYVVGPSFFFCELLKLNGFNFGGLSVVQLSVAVDVPDRDDPDSLLSILNRLKESDKISKWSSGTDKDVQNLTRQVAIELLRRKSSIHAASSRYKHVRRERSAKRLYDLWSVQECSKFKQKTINLFGKHDVSLEAFRTYGDDKSDSKVRGDDDRDSKATMAVVTLVLTTKGDSTKVSKIRSLADVEDALQRIAADVKMDICLKEVEIMWTPQDRSETLEQWDLTVNYPELTTV